MKKLIAACLLLGSFSAPAQTLFYYGKDSVSTSEFLRAYQKNNAGTNNEKSIKEYLDLYINSRLKIAEAKRLGYDTLSQLVADLDNLRQQITPGYIVDKQTMKFMVDEAFNRSQKDLHLAHIFISGADADKAAARLKAVEAALKSGTAFAAVAKQYSDDPSAATNGGDMGFITAFTLPYELENLAYNTATGKTSTTYKSKAGYHIFKNLGERKAVGRIKASQILFGFIPGASKEDKAATAKLADSVYKRLLKGSDFNLMASQFSNDVISSANNGRMAEFGTGEYSAPFESAAFALAKDGAFSAPVLTEHGYHIIRRDSRIPVSAEKTEKLEESLREKIEQNDRMMHMRSLLAQRIIKDGNFKKLISNEAALWSYSDSVLNGQHLPTHVNFSGATPLFQLKNKTINSSDWIGYAQTFRFKADGSGTKAYPSLWNEFIETTAIEYYQRNLELFNEDFRQQLQEFKDGNLFFEIMQREIWGPAQTDSAALVQYFNAHKAKYTWNKSADAVIFYASDEASAKSFITRLKRSPKNWKVLVEEMSAAIAADSARFETTQLPNPANQPIAAGLVTQPLINKGDGTASFALIIQYYPQTAPRSYADAKGLVITDYQEELEQGWVAQLKKKYPVRIVEKNWEEAKKK
jgi:peptidyl-prolyl cis-trans isomerase SurA